MDSSACLHRTFSVYSRDGQVTDWYSGTVTGTEPYVSSRLDSRVAANAAVDYLRGEGRPQHCNRPA